MASNRDSVDQLIGQWSIPTKGVWKTLAAHQIPLDALFDASNVIVRQGELRPRPGLTAFNPQALNFRPMGAIEYFDAAGGRWALVATSGAMFYYTGTVWQDITGGVALGTTPDLQARMTLIEFGTPAKVYAVHTNAINPPIQWEGPGSNFSTIAGSPPKWKDVTTAFDRIVGIYAPYTVQWGETLSLSTWPAVNTRSLSDTPDTVVAIRNLGSLGIVVYKERTIWVGLPQAGPSSSAFRFELRGWYEGPASPASVVDVNGVHYYLSSSGRIGRFDGNNHQWVADGIWPLVRTDFEAFYGARVFGVYDPRNSEIYWWFPRFGSTGEMTGILAMNLPYALAGIQDHAVFPGTSGQPCSAGFNWRTPGDNIDRAVVLTNTTSAQRGCYLDGAITTDDGVAFNCSIQTGLVTGPDVEVFAAMVEPFFLRGTGKKLINMQLMHSNALDQAGGTGADLRSIDLSKVPVKDFQEFTTRGRFFGLRFNFSADSGARYFGAHLYARRLS